MQAFGGAKVLGIGSPKPVKILVDTALNLNISQPNSSDPELFQYIYHRFYKFWGFTCMVSLYMYCLQSNKLF